MFLSYFFFNPPILIWITDSSGIQMIENSLIIKWSTIQITIWVILENYIIWGKNKIGLKILLEIFKH